MKCLAADTLYPFDSISQRPRQRKSERSFGHFCHLYSVHLSAEIKSLQASKNKMTCIKLKIYEQLRRAGSKIVKNMRLIQHKKNRLLEVTAYLAAAQQQCKFEVQYWQKKLTNFLDATTKKVFDSTSFNT